MAELPVGTVLPYAGRRPEQELQEQGWWLCQGQVMRIRDFPDLFDAIGTVNGGDGNTQFNLPDYRGRFLRGTCGGQGFDPNAADREAAASGGATGDRVGSVQGWATGNPGKKDGPLPLPKTPRTPFVASVPHLPSSHRDFNANEVTGHNMAWFSGTIQFSSDDGGDKETRPANANVQYLIKVKPGALSPAGAVVPFAGALTKGLTEWLLCDGTQKTEARESALYEAIGNNHGGSGDTFYLPDYRGRFLRGVDTGAGRDPEASSREAAAPGGSIGDAVGSVQKHATGRPRKPFTVSLWNMPRMACKLVECAAPWPNSYWNPDAPVIKLTATGGDNETRPENAAVDWLIRRAPAKGDLETFPVGAVIAFPGNTDPGDEWLPCIGQAESPKSRPDLFAVIGTLHGGDGVTSFYLPDYRGRFLRGVDRGAKRDPDAAQREQPQRTTGTSGDGVGSVQHWATAQPSKPITAAVAHLPNTCSSDTGYPGVGHDTCRWEPSDDVHVQLDASGGDDESRPVNAGVHFWIKMKNL